MDWNRRFVVWNRISVEDFAEYGNIPLHSIGWPNSRIMSWQASSRELQENMRKTRLTRWNHPLKFFAENYLLLLRHCVGFTIVTKSWTFTEKL